MGETKIEWAEKVWNPVTGCTKISSGCKNCYAERMSKRLAGRAGYPEDGFKVTLHPDKLEEPLRWKKPSRIFVCSMGDLFHEDVPFAFIDRVIDTIYKCPQHTFLILTKRPHFMKEYFEQIGLRNNIWLGTSIEDQKTADERIPLLLQTPAAKRFVSYEPALGPVDFTNIMPVSLRPTHPHDPLMFYDALRGHCKASDNIGLPKLDWIIMGGESGPGARPMHPDWARSVRDQCKAAGTPFFFKQWGEWAPTMDVEYLNTTTRKTEVHESELKEGYPHKYIMLNNKRIFVKDRMFRVGKARAGCLLDGKEHKERP